jgi:hypothetical protein
VFSLLVAVRNIRRECKFRPSIAEVIEALDDAGSVVTKAKQIVELSVLLDEAAAGLRGLVDGKLGKIRGLLSDRERCVDGGKTHKHIDMELKAVRSELADVLALSVVALEPQRLLIIQRIGKTKEEDVIVPW